MNDLDPIQNNNRLSQLAYGKNCKNGWINRRFIMPLVMVTTAVTIGLIGIDGRGSWDRYEFDLKRIAPHIVFPKSIWGQVDYVVIIGTVSSLVAYVFLIFSPRLDSHCCMQFIWNGSDRSEKPILINWRNEQIFADISDQIYKRRGKIRRITNWAYGIWLTSITIAFGQHMIVQNNVIWYPHVIFYWVVMVPIYFFYTIYSK